MQASPFTPSAASCQHVRFSKPLPYYAQVADRDHVAEYLDHGKDLALDPYWQHSDATSPAEYAYWALRSCGIVSIKSCIEAFGGSMRSVQEWINIALAMDGYLIEKDENGKTIEIGWKHQVLANLCQQENIPALPQAASLEDIQHALRQDKLVIASVSFEIGTQQRPITRRGGHLVVITGIDVCDGEIESVIINNPSGRGKSLQENAVIPVVRFAAAFSGRVIYVGTAQPIH